MAATEAPDFQARAVRCGNTRSVPYAIDCEQFVTVRAWSGRHHPRFGGVFGFFHSARSQYTQPGQQPAVRVRLLDIHRLVMHTA